MELKYIGKVLSYKVLRDYIIDNRLNSGDKIFLNSSDFNDLAKEFREVYNECMPQPLPILSVFVEESLNNKVPLNRIGISKFENLPEWVIRYYEFDYKSHEVFYQCGYCGNLINSNGDLLTTIEKKRAITYLNNKINSATKHIWGNCCITKRS